MSTRDFIADELIGYIEDRSNDNDFRGMFADAMELSRYSNQNFRLLTNIVEKAVDYYGLKSDDDIIELIEDVTEMFYAHWCLAQRNIRRELDRDDLDALEDLSAELQELNDEIAPRRGRDRDRDISPRTRGRRRRGGSGSDALSSAATSTRAFGKTGSSKERPTRSKRSSRSDVPELPSNGMSALMEASGAKPKEGIDVMNAEPYNHFMKDGCEYYLASKSPWKIKDRPWSVWADPRVEIPFHCKDETGTITEVVLTMDPKLEYERNRTMGAAWVKATANSVSTQKARNPLMANVLPKETINLGNDYLDVFKTIQHEIKSMQIKSVSTKTINDALTIARIKATGKSASVVRCIRGNFMIVKEQPVDSVEMGSTGVSAQQYLANTTADVHQVAYYNDRLTERVNRIVFLLTGNANSIVSFKEHYVDLLEAISKAVEAGAIGQDVFEGIVSAVDLEVIQVTTEVTADEAGKVFMDLLAIAEADDVTKERCVNLRFSNPITVSLCGYMDADHWEVFPGLSKTVKVLKAHGFVHETLNQEVNLINQSLLRMVEDGINGGSMIMEFRDGVRALLERVAGKVYLSKL